MKQFHCRCGQAVFFDSKHCVACGAALGFYPVEMEMLALEETADGHRRDPGGRRYRMCANRTDYDVCNWLSDTSSKNQLCSGCQFNLTIPNLGEKLTLVGEVIDRFRSQPQA